MLLLLTQAQGVPAHHDQITHVQCRACLQMCYCLAAVNVIPDKPNRTTPKIIQPGSSEVLSATALLSSLGGPKHAHQVCLNCCDAIFCSAML